MQKRKVIIHKHLFKNAGTSFDLSLYNNFGDAFFNHINDIEMIKQGESHLISFLKGNPAVKALSSHHVWFRFSPNDEIELIPVYILRHPIERIISVYYYEKVQNSDELTAKKAKELTFVQYVEWLMEDNTPAIIRNFQTRRIAGVNADFIAPLSQEELTWAFDEFNRTPLVGIVDQFNKSMRLFENEFMKFGFYLDLSFTNENVNEKILSLTLEQRIEQLKKELGSLMDEVIAKNEFDLLLYNKAIERLNTLND